MYVYEYEYVVASLVKGMLWELKADHSHSQLEISDVCFLGTIGGVTLSLCL